MTDAIATRVEALEALLAEKGIVDPTVIDEMSTTTRPISDRSTALR